MRRACKRVIYVLVFLLIFGLLFEKINYVLRIKVHQNDTVGSFYKEPKDSIDVVFVGSSHAFLSFSPMNLWDEYGITSYNLSTGCQPIACSYYLMKEAIRTQHPKVIVLETYTTCYSRDYTNSERVHQAIDGMPLNFTKMELVNDYLANTMTFDKRLEYVFPIILYHGRWKSIKSKDIHPQRTYLRGFVANIRVEPQKRPAIVTDEKNIYENNLIYIEKIIQLCNDNNVELVMCRAPIADGTKYEKTCRKVNFVKNYAIENNIPFIDYLDLADDIELDYDTDFLDWQHLNVIGAAKATGYMGQYLSDHYTLTDHRKDEAFSDWEKDSKSYQKFVAKREKKCIGNANK